MFKKFYQNDLKNIIVNEKLKRDLQVNLFKKKKEHVRTFLFTFRFLKFVAPVTFFIIFSISLFTYHWHFDTDAFSEDFFEKAYASYLETTDVEESFLFYKKSAIYPGKDINDYQDFMNKKRVQYVKKNQPQKLANVQKMIEQIPFFDLEYMVTYMSVHEIWKDKIGNSLFLDHQDKNQDGQLEFYLGSLKTVDPNTKIVNYYDNYRYFVESSITVRCIEKIPEYAIQLFQTNFFQFQKPIVSVIEPPLSEVSTNAELSIDNDKAQIFSMPKNIFEVYDLLDRVKYSEDPLEIIRILQMIQTFSHQNPQEEAIFEYVGEKNENGKSVTIFKLSRQYEIHVNYLTDYDLEELSFTIPAQVNDYYYFDSSNYQLLKNINTFIIEGKSFELVEIDYYQKYEAKPENHNIFDPKYYPQLVKFEYEPGCYFNTQSQTMKKMTQQEEEDFWKQLSQDSKESINSQKSELLKSAVL